jgi:hypothetical protein
VNDQPPREARRYERIQGDAARFRESRCRGESGKHTRELPAAEL